MKRLFLLFSVLAAIATGAWAQHFVIDPPLPGGQSTETVVRAKLNLGTTLSGNLSNYEVAALVNGEVRAIQTGNEKTFPGATTTADYNYFEFSIPGNFGTDASDNGKAITFKMYNSTSGLEYDLTTAEAMTFGENKTYGTLSSLVELSCTEVTGISAPTRIHMNYDETYDLGSQVSLTPNNATTPNNVALTWDAGAGTTAPRVSITADGKITSTEEPNGTVLTQYVYTRLGSLSASTDVQIHKHVKTVTSKGDITVSVGDVDGLTAALAAAFDIAPEGYTDGQDVMSSSNSEIVARQYSNGNYVFNPVSTGEATIYVSFNYYTSQTSKVTTARGQVTVKVVQPVTNINRLYESFECNVGDNLTEFIKQCYEVQPSNATDPSVTYELASGSAQNVVSISDNTITAVGKGTTAIVVRSVSNPDVSTTITVNVEQWATSVYLDRNSHSYTYKGQDIDISNDIFGIYNFSTGQWQQIGMAQANPFGYNIYLVDVTSSDDSVVEINSGQGSFENGWGATVKKAGTSTLTFTLRYPDYMAGTPGNPVIRTADAVTLRIDVSQGPTGFNISPTSIEMNVGNEIDLAQYVTVQPEGVDFSSANYVWTLVEESHSEYLQINGNTLKALAPNTEIQGSSVRLTLQGYEDLGSKDIFVTVYQPATNITVNTETITVNKGDEDALAAALAAAVTVNPENHTDNIEWASADESIVALNASNNQWNPIAGGTTTMTVTASSGGAVHATATITVNVNVPIESITLSDTNKPYINIGDDITEYLNSCITIQPEDATNKSYHFISYNSSRITVNSDGHVEAVGAGAVLLKAKADDGSEVISGNFVIAVYNQAKDVSFAKDITVKYTGNDVDISEEVKNNITFDPSDASLANVTVTSSNSSVATVTVDVARNQNGNPVDVTVTAAAKSIGETTVSMTVTYIDYLAERMDGQEHRTTVTRTFKIIVSEGLTGFDVALEEPLLAVGNTYTLTLTPQPADAEFDPDYIDFEVPKPVNFSSDFVDIAFVEIADGKAVYEISGYYPGESHLHVSYDDGQSQITPDPVPLTIGVATVLDAGWQWKTLWGPISNANFANHFIDQRIDEIRSQDALMANDAVYGYFGSLYDNGLQAGVAYKINANESIEIWEAAIQTGGSYLESSASQPLKKAWTWIGNPYVLYHKVSDVITSANEGDRIVSKDDGFAEYTGGAWTGSLTNLWPTQSYLYYNNSGAESQITWPAETALDQNSGGSNPAPARKVRSTWQYDASRFRDNMSMVASLDGIAEPERFTVGAFVDDECRGEGRCIDGLMFITVHADPGEEVSFRLEDTQTGEQYAVDQTVTMQLMRGSVKAPVRLSSHDSGIATAIRSTGSASTSATYDLSGRRVESLQRGVNIVRKQDGTVKKVIVK